MKKIRPEFHFGRGLSNILLIQTKNIVFKNNNMKKNDPVINQYKFD